ncbi:MAG: AI-2E family transporter [Microbacterium sp. SCN 70-200]|uniref:AI-2E family transporter n=1 Tax=unclassified Microbacterium TaxID=2609290 RepID=UPI000869B277|nr:MULTISPECIES: AI-2E family transporter [unclassified Microbacterium]MBN9213321.1 AI-2E family transporter [Microbacterium sp.]ODT40556.1 MAG: AI-2E family transporter [Microbacterium sp. SCN 70-200]OJV84972.1 MAG: AI-2E family transporter [Microbacterium sp. 70-16]
MSGTDESDRSDKPRGRLLDAIRTKTVRTEIDESLPHGLRVTTAYAWRFVVIAIAAGILIWLVIQLKLLVVPLLVALLITALLWPAFSWLLNHRVPRWLAIVISVVGALAIVGGLLWLAVWQITQEWSSVQTKTTESIAALRQFLIDGPLHLTTTQIDDVLAQAWDFLQQQVGALWSGALVIGSTVGHVLTGAVLALFILLCTLADGGGIWRWVVRLFPRRARADADGAGRAGWATVVTYARTQLLVATIDAIGIGVGAALLGVPLAIPVGVLVFLGAFIPFVGAVVTGALAVFLALVYNGPWIALWMLVVILGVQQLEGHVLQPLLMGSAVKVHPLAVVLVVAGGAMIAGIPGALFAVPLAAFVNVVAAYLSERHGGGAPPTERDLIWSTVPRSRRNPA